MLNECHQVDNAFFIVFIFVFANNLTKLIYVEKKGLRIRNNGYKPNCSKWFD